MDADKKKSKVSMMAVRSVTQPKSSAHMVQGKSLSRMKVRKGSYGFGGGVPGVKIERRSSQGIEFKRPQLMYLNTYQLDPRVKFHVPTVSKIIDALLDVYFNDHVYNAADSPSLALRMAGDVMRALKTVGFSRYRIIAVVTVGQRRAQSYYNAVAFLWDHERDSLVDVVREVTTAFIHVTVFGVYLD